MTIVSLAEQLDAMNNPDFDDTQKDHIENVILPGVQNRLEGLLNRKVEKTRIREALAPDNEGYIEFSETPVWEVLEVMRTDGTTLDLPTIPDPPALPVDASVRTIDLVGMGMSYEPFRYFTGYRNPFSVMLTQYEPSFYVTYYAGYPGQFDEALKLKLIQVGAREIERKFIDTVGMRQGSVEAGQETDDRPIDWTEEEVAEFDHIRRRVVV